MDKMVKIVFVSLLVVVGGVVFFTPSALADTPELTLEHSPPCLLNNLFGNCVDPTNSFAAYIKRIYQFGLGIAGALAILMIVIGAMRRVVSAGNPGQIEEGNNMIKSALVGILLLFGSYLILRTINPELVTLKDPSASGVEGITPYVSTSTIPSDCPVASHTSCFFNPQILAEHPEEPTLSYCGPSQLNNCTAILRTGNICDPSANRGCVTRRDGSSSCRPTPQEAPCTCVNCIPLASTNPVIKVKAQACNNQFNSATGRQNECFLENTTYNKTYNLFSDLNTHQIRTGTRDGEWRLTEVFPPNVPHFEPGHYNGTTIDMGLSGGVHTQEECRETLRVAALSSKYFSTVLIEGPPMCPGVFPQTTGPVIISQQLLAGLGAVNLGAIRRLINEASFHLHIAN